MTKTFHQLLPNYSRRDAIGTEATIIRDCLRNAGYRSEIFVNESSANSDAIHSKHLQAELAKESGTRVLFHFSVGSDLSKEWPKLNCERWLRYHNVTPKQFFTRSDELHARHVCGLGRIQLRRVVEASDVLLADSNYNAEEIKSWSKSDVKVIPVFRDYEILKSSKYDKNLAQKILASPIPNVLFVGRVAPNKCHHDLLQLLALHKKNSRPRVRLIFAGGYFSESYKRIIQDFASALGLTIAHDWNFDADVLSLGSISDEELVALYRSVRLYASMSEHEGFGVPIVEAMYFDLPVFAHKAAAVPEVLGDGAFLVDKFNWTSAVDVFNKSIFDDVLRVAEIDRTKAWRDRFSRATAEKKLLDLLR